MEVLCKKTLSSKTVFRKKVYYKYHFRKGKWYIVNLSKTDVSKLSDKKTVWIFDNNKQDTGQRFWYKKPRYFPESSPIFSEYFYSAKELRKEKLKKIYESKTSGSL